MNARCVSVLQEQGTDHVGSETPNAREVVKAKQLCLSGHAVGPRRAGSRCGALRAPRHHPAVTAAGCVIVGTAKVLSTPTTGSTRLSRLHDSSPSAKLNSSRTSKGVELTGHRQEASRKSRTVSAGASTTLLRILRCLQVCCRSWDV